MSDKPIENAAKKISIKRKRAPVWPFATRATLERAVHGLVDQGIISELSPRDEWRVHPSTEARGSGFQHERLVRGINDRNEWITLKLRQHAQDPERTAGRTGFEGSEVADLNANLTKLLRSAARGGRTSDSVSALKTSQKPDTNETGKPKEGSPGKSAQPQESNNLPASPPSADELE